MLLLYPFKKAKFNSESSVMAKNRQLSFKMILYSQKSLRIQISLNMMKMQSYWKGTGGKLCCRPCAGRDEAFDGAYSPDISDRGPGL